MDNGLCDRYFKQDFMRVPYFIYDLKVGTTRRIHGKLFHWAFYQNNATVHPHFRLL